MGIVAISIICIETSHKKALSSVLSRSGSAGQSGRRRIFFMARDRLQYYGLNQWEAADQVLDGV